jgi:hypothetical protein
MKWGARLTPEASLGQASSSPWVIRRGIHPMAEFVMIPSLTRQCEMSLPADSDSEPIAVTCGPRGIDYRALAFLSALV